MKKILVQLDTDVHTRLSELKATSGVKVRSLSQTIGLLLDYYDKD